MLIPNQNSSESPIQEMNYNWKERNLLTEEWKKNGTVTTVAAILL